jgi:hypothetical protein
MKLLDLKRTLVTTAVSVAALVGGAVLTNAQNVSREYRDWQRAQAEVQRECYDYQRTGRRSDYRDCQRAQREAQREYNDYQRAASRNTNVYYGNGYYNNGYYNNNRSSAVLRAAINQGYRDGYNRGQMDRRYRRGYAGNGYYNNGYDSATQYYYQQGFQRGYEDGFNSTMRYGYRSGNSYNILGSILGTILNLASQ